MRIKTRLIVSNIAMLIVPICLIALISVAFRATLSSDAQRAFFSERHDQLSDAQLTVLCETISANPGFFESKDAIDRFAGDMSWQGTIAIAIGDKVIWQTPGANGDSITKAIARAKENEGKHALRRRPLRLSSSVILGVQDGVPVKAYFLIDYRRYFSTMALPAIAYVFLVALILIMTSVALTYFVFRSVLRPLRSLEERVRKISDGDLAPTETDGNETRPDDEFTHVFSAFDEMRGRLRESLVKQQGMEENRRELVASISHDLRTPLAAIKGYAEGLKDGIANSTDRRDRYLNTILSKTVVMEKLIEDLFLFSRLEADGFAFDKKRIDPLPWLSDLLDELAPDFPGIRIERAFDSLKTGSSLAIQMDSFRMARVITNIVQNAAAYVKCANPAILVSGIGSEGWLSLRFADNGEGIRPEDRERVFDCHFRADPSRHKEGSGLGLTIARLIVEGHGGAILAEEAHADEGGGACIVIRLPLENP